LIQRGFHHRFYAQRKIFIEQINCKIHGTNLSHLTVNNNGKAINKLARDLKTNVYYFVDTVEAQKIIRETIDRNMSKNGYVWRSKAYDSLSGVRAVIVAIKEYINSKGYFDAIKLLFVSLEELRVVDIDDSNDGCCGEIYFELVELLGTATVALDPKNHNKAFGLILNFINKECHNCLTDAVPSILETMRPLCLKSPKRLKIVEDEISKIKEKWEDLPLLNPNDEVDM
jgi:hypothetical protein